MPQVSIPDANALQHSTRVLAHLRRQISAANEMLSFAEFMDAVLYAPGLGYYVAGACKFGEGGDFITAPEISPLFAQCLARQCADVLAILDGGEILEFGAGSGILAADLLDELAYLGCLPQRYAIVEVSAGLRAQQAETLARQVPHLQDRVIWLDRLPDKPLRGVVLANEVLDAMPVQRVCWQENGMLDELCVTWEGESLAWCTRRADAKLSDAAQAVLSGLPHGLPDGYVSEINLNLQPWLQAVSEILDAGLVLVVDYGFPRHEYYHPQRGEGTLMCHYRHHSHSDPFFYPGLQDITAHVDFSALADAALACGFKVAGYTSQGAFLVGCGLEQILQRHDSTHTAAWLRLTQAAKKLMMPQEMGELFKVIALSRDLAALPLRGFIQDRRGRL